MALKWMIFSISFISFASNSLQSANEVEVHTPEGIIIGFEEESGNGNVIHKFLGIPFAKPPIGELRFKPPQPLTKSFGRLMAKELGNDCVQQDYSGIKGSEDCLFLNVHVNGKPKTDDLSPVMVWIHGGGFILGGGGFYNPKPLVEQDIIVVTINYRLSAFGFMTFGNELVGGNMGLRDQIAAIEWTKRNIASFGGNPDKITIFGESAGGASASALHLSPKVDGLISGAIMQSGTMLLSKHFHKISKVERMTNVFNKKFGCNAQGNDTDLLECLQNIDVEELYFKSQILYDGTAADGEEPHKRAYWWPVVDDYHSDPVIPMDPLKALSLGKFNKIPIMTGTMKNDGALIFPKDAEKDWNNLGPLAIFSSATYNTSEFTEEEWTRANIIRKYYIGDCWDITGDCMEGYYDMKTDALFLSPDQKLAEIVTSHGSEVFNYRINYVGNNTLLPIFIARNNYSNETKDRIINGLKPAHGDDLFYVFDMAPRNAEDEEFSNTMVKYWTNFAKYGNPSPTPDDNLTPWKPYSDKKWSMQLDKECKMEAKIEKERMLLWEDIIWKQRASLAGIKSECV